MTILSIYLTLVIVTCIFFLFEIIMPGGVLGLLGTLTLFGAGITGFYAFGSEGGFISIFVLLLGLFVYAILVVRVLPHSSFGRMFTLSEDMKDSKSSASTFHDLVGQTGTAVTDLRPSGIVRIGKRRVDVVAEGNWIANDSDVKVVEVEGHIVTVREIQDAE